VGSLAREASQFAGPAARHGMQAYLRDANGVGGLAGYGVSRDEPFCLASAYVVRIQSQGR